METDELADFIYDMEDIRMEFFADILEKEVVWQKIVELARKVLEHELSRIKKRGDDYL
jgi:hypothetical protein